MKKPKWLDLGERLLGPTLASAKARLERPHPTDFDLSQISVLALYHLASSLDTSIEANQEGRHSVAICLIRHCVEALTLIDVGLQEDAFAYPLLNQWRDGKKTSGELRKTLEQGIWPRYGTGLWNETWAEFFGNLSKAVQPYAHCSRELLEWQLAVLEHNENTQRFVVSAGTYDPLKASRITLLHVLIGWTLARLLLANQKSLEVAAQAQDIHVLGEALSNSKLLMKQKDWGLEMLPNMFFKHGNDWHDE